MTETYPKNQPHSQLGQSQINSCLKDPENKTKHRNTFSSSSLDSSFENIDYEIKSIIENEHDLSFSSDSNSELAESKTNMDYLFNHKFWRYNTDKTQEKEKNKKNQPSPIKYSTEQTMAGISEGSNKISTQSNEEEESPVEHLQNVSSFESNNNSSSKHENEEKEKEKIKEEKKGKEKENIFINNNNTNNNINSNNIHNLKLNKNFELDYIYPYDTMNYKNNNINNINNMQSFQGVYLYPQIYPFMPSYNYPSLNKKNFITNNNNNNNINNKISGNNSPNKTEQIKPITNLKLTNQYMNPYLNNINNMNNYNKKINQNQLEIKDLPLVINNGHNNTMNYNCQKINFNMISCPQIPPVNPQIQKQSLEKSNNSSNLLPEINHKENTKNINNEKKNKNNNNSNNNNICPIIGKGNNEIKINNKSFVNNKSNNNINKSINKGEKQILNLDDIVTGKDTRTTVMIRNIPIKYTDQILTNALSEFNGKYDCLYMPYDYEKNGNKGYAFINFVNPLHILYFYEKFNGKRWVHFESAKICELNCAHFQGINEIQKHAKNYKGQKKPNYYSISENENMIIPLKYLPKLLKRFPKMKYTENKGQNIINVKAFE